MQEPFEISVLRAQHVSALAQLHLEAFPASEGSPLGYRYAFHFVDWFRQAADTVAIVALADGPIGYALGVPEAELARLYRRLVPVVLGCVLARPWIVAHPDVRGMAIQRLRLMLSRSSQRRRPDDACMRLRTLGVRSDWRRRGVASALVDRLTHDAAQRGMGRLMASTRRTNGAAHAFYERRGWRRCDSGDDEFLDYSVALVARASSTPRIE